VDKEGEIEKIVEKSALEIKERESTINGLREQVSNLNVRISEHEKSAANLQVHIRTLQNRTP
jgi:predicted RNase H-like nuclease (RuvC/YqgF family)